jgi:hypothetical protein
MNAQASRQALHDAQVVEHGDERDERGRCRDEVRRDPSLLDGLVALFRGGHGREPRVLLGGFLLFVVGGDEVHGRGELPEIIHDASSEVDVVLISIISFATSLCATKKWPRKRAQ